MAEKPIQDSIEILKKAKEEINKLLAAPRYNGNLLEINANLKRVETRLVFMGGVLERPRRDQPGLQGARHQPMKTFMGKPLNAEATEMDPVLKKKTLLNAEEAEMDHFRTKVKKLAKDILNFPAQSILTNYRIPEDILVIRGVAKVMGIEDFKTRELTVAFINEIKAAVERAGDQAAIQAKVDASLKKEKGGPGGAQKVGAKVERQSGTTTKTTKTTNPTTKTTDQDDDAGEAE